MADRRTLLIRVALLGALPLMSACSETTRFRVLSFLFDGVPEPGAQRSGPIRTEASAAGPPSAQQRREPEPVKDPVYVHAPYANNRCRGCHDPGSGLLFRSIEEGLCQTCHADIPGQVAWVHGPVAVNACATCHHYHSSSHPKLLLAEPNQVCFRCHDRADLTLESHHATIDETTCTECHDPHGGSERFLLRRGER